MGWKQGGKRYRGDCSAFLFPQLDTTNFADDN